MATVPSAVLPRTCSVGTCCKGNALHAGRAHCLHLDATCWYLQELRQKGPRLHNCCCSTAERLRQRYPGCAVSILISATSRWDRWEPIPTQRGVANPLRLTLEGAAPLVTFRERMEEPLAWQPLHTGYCSIVQWCVATSETGRALRQQQLDVHSAVDCLGCTTWKMAVHTDCRMYESKFPEVDDVVMVQVKSIAEMGAYVSLLEYNGIEGMILLSELSRRRIRSITKLIKVLAAVRHQRYVLHAGQALSAHLHARLLVYYQAGC